MRRPALLAAVLALALVPAPGAHAQGPPAGGTVTGIAYQDANADGVQQPTEGGLAGWIVWADLDGNGARDATEPSATAGADGRYTLGPLAAGNYSLHIQAPDASPCPEGAVCSHELAVNEGMPATLDFPIASAADPGRQLLDGGGVRVGEVKLAVPGGCSRKRFAVVLTGSGAVRVDFRIDGRVIRSVRRSDAAGRFTIHIDPRKLRPGRHTLTAAVWFSKTEANPGRQISRTLRTCAPKRRH